MKIKNLSVRKRMRVEMAIEGSFKVGVLSYLIPGSMFLGFVGITAGYYSYNNQEQIIDDVITEDDTFIDENGNICCYFAEGEHRISISRNDAYYHGISQIDGYEIESVKVNGWRDNNTTIYVNKEPVIAEATSVKNQEILFEDFGTVTDKVKQYSK